MASYDQMTATDHNMLENMEESTYEMTKSHAKRVDNLYSRIRNIKIKIKHNVTQDHQTNQGVKNISIILDILIRIKLKLKLTTKMKIIFKRTQRKVIIKDLKIV